jgi:hypothetical protein
MKRRWNVAIWVGFAIVLFALASYIRLFALFPATRDVPWANYLCSSSAARYSRSASDKRSTIPSTSGARSADRS